MNRSASRLSVPQLSTSSATLGVPPSTPARPLRNLRTRSPQHPSPGFVLTGSDSRRRITREDASPSRPTSPTEEDINPSDTTGKRARDEESDGGCEPEASVSVRKKKKTRTKGPKDQSAPEVVDVDQDSSSDEIVESRPGHTNDVKQLLEYFGVPKHYKNETGPFKRYYPCRWCGEYYTRGFKSNDNLYGHRDGDKDRQPCQGRNKAIKSGMKLPPTYQQLQKAANQKTPAGQFMNSFLERPVFSVQMLNILLVLWIIRHALPWMRFSDPILRGAFKLANTTADIRSPTWAAQTAKKVYKSLHSEVLRKVKANTSRIWLVHDVWTTRGNRYAFIALIACYIDEGFKYCRVLLTLKMVAWNHYGALLARPVARYLIRHDLHHKVLGQTTDSGSNNNTMAIEMEVMFAAADKPVDWDSAQHHARCYCHKLALVVRAGLKALSIESGHSKPTTEANLPVPIPTFQLNDNEVELPAESADSDEDEPLDESDQGPDLSDDNFSSSVSSVSASHTGNIFATAVQKVDTVSKKIAGSHSRRQEFRGLCKEAGLDHRTPIAGYGIRWNVIYDSRNRMCAAQEIVNKMLATDRKGAQYFKGILIHADEWEAIEALNNILEIFASGTKRMEGDFPSGAMVLVEYHRIKKSLQDARSKTRSKPLIDMIGVMINQLELYVDEALECNTLVLANIVHPQYRLAFMQKAYPDHKDRATDLLNEAFASALKTYQQEHESSAQQSSTPANTAPLEDDDDDFNEFTCKSNTQTAREGELESYLMGHREYDKNKSPLDWWDTNSVVFPVLATLARDYMAVSGTSCPAERVFSSAADVCTQDRGGLIPSTMSRLVCSREWLKDGIDPAGDYGAAIKYITSYLEGVDKKKKKEIIILDD